MTAIAHLGSAWLLCFGLARAPAGEDAPAPDVPQPQLLDRNLVLAAVNNEVVTIRDVKLEWRLKQRRSTTPDTASGPSKEEIEKLKKEIVVDRLWIAKAKEHPLYAEFVTQRIIDEQAKDERMFGALFDDPSVSDEERALMRAKAEAFIAVQVLLQNDARYQRCLDPRPADVRKVYDSDPQRHRIPTRVTLGKVQLSRENCKELYGEEADLLIDRIRLRAIELSSLEEAAKELAPGSFQRDPTEYDIERNTDLLDAVRDFAKGAPQGALSSPIAGRTSLMLFTVLTRKEGEDWTYDKAAPQIRRLIEARAAEIRMNEYFVYEILLAREAFYWPQDLFDDEIRRFLPQLVRRRPAAPPAAASGAAAAGG